MIIQDLQAVILKLAYERSVRGVLNTIVESLAAQKHTALARIWLAESTTSCSKKPPSPQFLNLVASDGQSLDSAAPRWRNLKGGYQRFEFGERKVGKIFSNQETIFLTDLGNDSNWLADPEWGKRERILSFAGHPLIFRGEALGVLAIFSREVLRPIEVSLLRTFADHAAAAVANARAFEEIECLREQLELENEYLREEVLEAYSGGAILGESSAIAKVLRQIELVAPTDSNVLIQGESGTGKELIARAIHEKSQRANHPLVKVNCAAISKELFESEFFGHVQGAFSGALKDRRGRFELANGGTLFLDEVGEIPLGLQGKLLRVLQEGEFERVGDEHTRHVDVRLIAATNRDLKIEAERGSFRQDLYFRLSVFPIESPPLRDRTEDIPLLASHFLDQAAMRFHLPVPHLKQRHVLELQEYAWPGNVRELQNVMERAAITSQEGLLKLDIPKNVDKSIQTQEELSEKKIPRLFTYPELKQLEEENLRRALHECNGKVAGKGGAAELLSANPTTLASRIKRFGLGK